MRDGVVIEPGYDELVAEVIAELRRLPVEQRMEAMGMRQTATLGPSAIPMYVEDTSDEVRWDG